MAFAESRRMRDVARCDESDLAPPTRDEVVHQRRGSSRVVRVDRGALAVNRQIRFRQKHVRHVSPPEILDCAAAARRRPQNDSIHLCAINKLLGQNKFLTGIIVMSVHNDVLSRRTGPLLQPGHQLPVQRPPGNSVQ